MAKAAQAPNFGSILDRAPSEIEKPKPLPQGSYITVLVGQPRFDKSAKKQTEFVEFTLKTLAAGEDVDEDALKEMGGLGDKTIRATYYLTEDAVFRLDEFHEHCGLDITEKASRRARNEEVVNAQVKAVVKHRSSQDGSQVFAELARTALAD